MPSGLSVKDLTLSDLLERRNRISVPIYQRDYSWERKNVEQLLDDLEEEANKARDNRALFMGTVVFNVETVDGKPTVDLIDGQQRLLTFSLIMAWFARKLQSFESNKGGALQQKLYELLYSEPVVEDEEGNLTFGEPRIACSFRDQENFVSLLKNGKARDGRSRLGRAWKIVGERLETVLRTSAEKKGIDPDDEKKFLKQVVEQVTGYVDVLYHRTTFGVIEVAEPYNAFAVFESLNSKGLELAQSDLIKNFLLKQLPEKLRPSALDQWNRMVAVVPGEKVVDFLRAWYIAYHEFVQRIHVYEQFKRHLASRERIKESLDDWERSAWWYWAFVEGRIHDEHPGMDEVKVEAALSRALAKWKDLGFKQGNAVLLAFVHSNVFDPSVRKDQLKLVDAIEALESAYIRLFVTANVRGSVFESEVARLCSIGRNNREQGVENLRAELRAMCRTAGVEKSLDWSRLTMPVPGQARHLLYRIAEHQAGQGVELKGADEWHVEHILPQARPKNALLSMSDEDYDEIVPHIGNLTLLLNSDNTGLKNSEYKKKWEIYKLYDGKSVVDDEGDYRRPHLPMVLDIPRKWPTEWNEATIRARAVSLGEYAAKVWPI